MDFVSGGKRACGYRQTAENEAVGVELPFRAHEKDFLHHEKDVCPGRDGVSRLTV